MGGDPGPLSRAGPHRVGRRRSSGPTGGAHKSPSASLPEELAAKAADLGLPALALLDRDRVYGAPRFHQAALRAGLRAHIGFELTLEDGSRWPLLVETRAGYQNLCRLVTRMKLRAKKGEGAGWRRWPSTPAASSA